MSQILLGLIGIAVFASLAAASVSWWGPRVRELRVESEAVRYIHERGQLALAMQRFVEDRGSLPDGTLSGADTVADLTTSGHLASRPPGGALRGGQHWAGRPAWGAVVAPVAGDSGYALRVCIEARRRVGMPAPAQVFACDGADAPGGVLDARDPCCRAV